MTRYFYRPDLRDECAEREEHDPFDNSDEERDYDRDMKESDNSEVDNETNE